MFWALILGLFSLLTATAQRIEPLIGKEGISFRGLSVVNNRLLWVSGSKGTVGRSTDGGKTFQWMTVPGHAQRDFRDIEAFDAVTAVLLAVDSPGLILRTFDGGATWQEVYSNHRSGVFLDALHFRDKLHGFAIGDPLDGQFLLLETRDGGRSWAEVSGALPAPIAGEAFFAASGGNVVALKKSNWLLVSGGAASRVLRPGDAQVLPLKQGQASTGANAIALKKFSGRGKMVVVGGDFGNDKQRDSAAAYSSNGGRTWQLPMEAPFGYRSGVAYVRGNRLVACGTSGVDLSRDGGKRWQNISTTGYHVVKRAKDGRAVFLAGGNGRIAKLVW